MSLESIELKKFAAELAEEVSARQEAEPDSPSSVALAQIMLESLSDSGMATETEFCPFEDASGRRRCSITAYSFDEAEDRLALFLAHFAPFENGVETLGSGGLANLAGKAARFLDYSAKKEWERFAQLPEVLDAARKIHSEIKRLTSVRIFILTNMIVRERDIETLEVAGLEVKFEVVDLARLFRIANESTSRQDIEIDFVALNGRPMACLEMSPRAQEYETYLAIFPGKLLFDLYDRYGQRLFEFNVRSFLQAKGKVNKGIRDTLRDYPDRFMAYNNGIVATADELEIQTFHGETAIARIIGLQIVNGAQTTASIYRAKKAEKIDLALVSVAVKITKVSVAKLQEFVPLISRFANTQNVIQIADLSANNEFHIELERLSQQVWCPGEESRWFYERARGAYLDALQRDGSTAAKRREFKRATPISQKFTKTDLSKYLVAWMGRPHTVSLGAQKNFAIFMAELPEIFPADWKPDREFYKRCVSQAIIFRACERIVRARKFPAYRANIAVYTYALLAHLSGGELQFERIWEAQRVSDPLAALLDAWTVFVDDAIRRSAGAKNITEWCKKPECWNAIRGIAVRTPDKLPPELVKQLSEQSEALSGLDRSSASWEDEEAIEECMKYDAATWAKLNFWGVSTNSLDYYERGVAHTLSEYAASGWSKRPSPKQARIGTRVLRRGKDAQLL